MGFYNVLCRTQPFCLARLISGSCCRNINSRSVFLGCKYAIQQFFSQPPHSSDHRGWIINTASMLGLVGLKSGAAAYCASKGAVVLLTKQIAVEYASDKIHCNALCPGCGSLSLSPVDVLRERFSKRLETRRGMI